MKHVQLSDCEYSTIIYLNCGLINEYASDLDILMKITYIFIYQFSVHINYFLYSQSFVHHFTGSLETNTMTNSLLACLSSAGRALHGIAEVMCSTCRQA